MKERTSTKRRKNEYTFMLELMKMMTQAVQQKYGNANQHKSQKFGRGEYLYMCRCVQDLHIGM